MFFGVGTIDFEQTLVYRRGFNTVWKLLAFKIAISFFNAKCLGELLTLFPREDWHLQMLSYRWLYVLRTSRRRSLLIDSWSHPLLPALLNVNVVLFVPQWHIIIHLYILSAINVQINISMIKCIVEFECDLLHSTVEEKKEDIWLNPLTKAPTPTEMSKGQSDNINNVTKKSITHRLRTDLGRSVEVTTATQLVWLTWFTSPTFPFPATTV